jgi:hypothetical protein
MKCYAQFHAFGYAPPMPDDYEEFDSISAVKKALQNRYDFNLQFPCVESDAYFMVWLGRPKGDFPCDCYPDRKVFIGPRDGIRSERT